MLKPNPGETQPQFAVRFHQEMKAEIPRTSERNRAMLDQWEKYGDEQEREIGDGIFDVDQYERRANIPVFAEHETPERSLPDGRKLPADHYDRAALEAITERQNYRIRDTQIFSPITLGHTSDAPGGHKPEILGFCGPARLGMIGDEKPRWAIFQDEYQRKDCAEKLKNCTGRSVEIWKHPEMKDRFFYPVAALDVDAPRLELPPARYAKDGSDAQVPVECYSLLTDAPRDDYMASPGGNATAIPGFSGQRDEYGNNSPDGVEIPDDAEGLNRFMEAFMNSQFGQYLLQQMEKDGMAGSVSPLVSQPPEPTDVPVDSVEDQQGQSDQYPAVPPDPAETQAPPPQPPGQQDGGSPAPTQRPPMKGYSMSGTHSSTAVPTEKYAQLEQQVQTLKQQNDELRDRMAKQEARNIARERYSQLTDLAHEYQLDVNKELERTQNYSADQFETHLGVIKENYQKRPDAVEDYSAIAGVGRTTLPQHAEESQRLYNEPAAEDCQSIVKYAQTYGLDWETAREKYMAQKTTNEPAAA